MKSRTWALLLCVIGGSAAVAVACGGAGDGSEFIPYGYQAPEAGPTDDGPTPPPFTDGTIPIDDGAVAVLTITPADKTIDVTAPTTVQFQALERGNPVPATWNLDTGGLGTIDGNGLFRANATAGGVVTVFAQTAKKLSAKTTLTVHLKITENPGNVDDATKAKLMAGGQGDTTFAWLYPYDKTVFPRGLLPPTLQFAGVAPTAVYVKVTSKALTYEGFYGGSDPGRVDFDPAIWKTITTTALANDPVKIEVTKISNGDGGQAVAGPISETWTIAQGSLKGLVYYNTYDSPLAQGDAGPEAGNNDQGAVMRIKPGATLPEVFIGGAARGSCTVCHTVSANGSVMAAAAGHQYDAIYAITPDASAPSAPLNRQPDNTYSFGALTPDGKYILTCGATQLDAGADASPDAPAGPPGNGEFGPNVVSMSRAQTSRLLDTADGGVVIGSLLDGGVQKALMPAFSPDGKRVAFQHYELSQGTSLSVMDFDQTTQSFSNLAEVVRDPNVTFGWPSFLPDGKSFVYMVGDRDDYATWRGGSGELLLADIASKNATKLRVLNGVMNGKVYLQDNGEIFQNYEPTVLPVAAGGYYWVVFTSRRRYGNIITQPDQTETIRKKLWVAAIDIGTPINVDPSHPAFYLAGQETASGNLRGFWALDPCRQNGNSCESGSECCTGFCREVDTDGGRTFACVAPPPTCSQEEEKCTTKADCCQASLGFECINGHCSRPTPK